jgi:hypothetical protein
VGASNWPPALDLVPERSFTRIEAVLKMEAVTSLTEKPAMGVSDNLCKRGAGSLIALSAR